VRRVSKKSREKKTTRKEGDVTLVASTSLGGKRRHAVKYQVRKKRKKVVGKGVETKKEVYRAKEWRSEEKYRGKIADRKG